MRKSITKLVINKSVFRVIPHVLLEKRYLTILKNSKSLARILRMKRGT